MPIDKTKLSKEMMRKALQCETADELLALAKANGVDGPYVDCFTDCLLDCVNRHT